MQKMRIGVLAYRMDYYTNLRNIVNILPEADYVPVWDVFSYHRAVALKLNRLIGKPLIQTFDLNNQFDDYDLNRVSLLHFSNGISYGKTPWVTHFETLLPRLTELLNRPKALLGSTQPHGRLTLKGMEALRGAACKQLIAMSENAANFQRRLMTEFASEFSEPILAKIRVLHPPQEALVEQAPQREYDQQHPIRFLLVGSGFFRKGGAELFKVFEKLALHENLPIRLVVVSSLHLEPYAAHETEEDLLAARRIIEAKPRWLEYYESLPNVDVQNLMKGADVGLLPTWADTYGFSVLEAQAAGCPVISTDVRALPEINNGRIGWLIHVPKDELGEATYASAVERQAVREQIESGLESIVREIAENPGLIVQKGQAALERIRADHDPLAYAEALRQIYYAALS